MKKRLLAVLTVLVFVLAMSMPALAVTDSTPATGSLTVTGNELTGKTVSAYRIFTASWVDSSETDTADDNIDANDTISYVLETAWNNSFSAISAIANDTSDRTLSEKATDYISGLTEAQLVALSKDLKDYADRNNISASYTSGAASNDSVTITNMVPGYYLVVPQAGSTNATRNTDATLVNVPSQDSAAWAIKSEYPTVTKTVDGDNTVSSAKIGDTVTFTLESKVPDMSEYNYYVFYFTDTLSSGLTYAGHMTVTISDENNHSITLTPANTTASPAVAGDYTANDSSPLTISVGTPKTVQNEENQDIDVRDLKTLIAGLEYPGSDNTPVSAGDTITVTYDATLNENAFIQNDGDANTSNDNTVTVSYSNDPGYPYHAGTSTPSQTKSYTYEITIDKHDNSQTPVQLAGAVFELKQGNDVIGLVADGQLIDTNDNTTVLADKYRVATADDAAADILQTVTTGDSGNLLLEGLETGTYTLTEISAPTGYNKLASPITITIAPGNSGTEQDPVYDDYENPVFTVDGNTDDSTIDVVNTAGAVLPTTGSIGTIGLTAAGVGVIIIGIVVTSRKKKSKRTEKAE